MNEWMGICRSTTKTPLIVVPATGEHAFTARPGQTERSCSGGDGGGGRRAGLGGRKCRRSVERGDQRDVRVCKAAAVRRVIITVITGAAAAAECRAVVVACASDYDDV